MISFMNINNRQKRLIHRFWFVVVKPARTSPQLLSAVLKRRPPHFGALVKLSNENSQYKQIDFE